MREAETVTVVARIYPKAGKDDEVAALLVQMAEAVRQRPGPRRRVAPCPPGAGARRGAARGGGGGDGIPPARRRGTTSGSGRRGRRRGGPGRLPVVEDPPPPHSAWASRTQVPHRVD